MMRSWLVSSWLSDIVQQPVEPGRKIQRTLIAGDDDIISNAVNSSGIYFHLREYKGYQEISMTW